MSAQEAKVAEPEKDTKIELSLSAKICLWTTGGALAMIVAYMVKVHLLLSYIVDAFIAYPVLAGLAVAVIGLIFLMMRYPRLISHILMLLVLAGTSYLWFVICTTVPLSDGTVPVPISIVMLVVIAAAAFSLCAGFHLPSTGSKTFEVLGFFMMTQVISVIAAGLFTLISFDIDRFSARDIAVKQFSEAYPDKMAEAEMNISVKGYDFNCFWFRRDEVRCNRTE